MSLSHQDDFNNANTLAQAIGARRALPEERQTCQMTLLRAGLAQPKANIVKPFAALATLCKDVGCVLQSALPIDPQAHDH